MAIIGIKKEDLTFESLLKRTSEYEIYRTYLGYNFHPGDTVKSPFRNEMNPSMIIGNRGGFLHHTDLGDSKFKGNCVQFVEQLYGLSYHEALVKIDQDLGLGITAGQPLKDYRKVIKEAKNTIIVEKKSPIIHVKSRPFSPTELSYWQEFHIDKQRLKKHHVYAVKELLLNRRRFPLRKTDLTFGYLYDKKWKIYRPLADKAGKWMTNVPGHQMDGLENIPSCDKAIITKSKKDLMVLEQVFPYVCAVQSESTGALSAENLAFLRQRAKEIYVNFDCDEVGKKNSWYYTRDFGFKHINVPDEYFQQYRIKDFADLARKFGLQAVLDCFSRKNIVI